MQKIKRKSCYKSELCRALHKTSRMKETARRHHVLLFPSSWRLSRCTIVRGAPIRWNGINAVALPRHFFSRVPGSLRWYWCSFCNFRHCCVVKNGAEVTFQKKNARLLGLPCNPQWPQPNRIESQSLLLAFSNTAHTVEIVNRFREYRAVLTKE